MTPTPRILIVSTSADTMTGSGKSTGLWLEELTAPYYAFRDMGAEVTLASIAGGQIPIDERSLDEDLSGEGSVARYAEDPALQALVADSPRFDQFRAEDFDAIFLPGGHGTMFDFPENKALAQLVSDFAADGKIVSAVCHGPAGLLGATLPNGTPLVAGRRMTGFANAEEEDTGLRKDMPFLLETRLRALGADYESGPAFTPLALRDGMLITGQNPASAEEVAHLVGEALGERLRKAA